MNKRVITSVLNKKFNHYLKSIKDDKVRELVKNNSIITGGCIASMLLKEDVNDFDIYFTNFETVHAVSEYYLELFKSTRKFGAVNGSLTIEDGTQEDWDGKPIGNPEEPRVKIKISSAGVVGENTGDSQYRYQEDVPVNDTEQEYMGDVLNNIEEADLYDGELLDDDKKELYRPVFLSSNAITLSDDIQLIIRFYGQAEEIHKNYDFVHCTNYWTSKDKKLTLRAEALEALLAKELRYVGSRYPLCSLIRIRKFLGRGYHINAGQILKIALQLQEFDLTDVRTLEDQLTGVDTAYFLSIIDAVKEKQKGKGEDSKIDASYIVTLVDRIF